MKHKYNVGDRVRIVKEWNKDTCQSIFGSMDKWLGKVMTIKRVVDSYGFGVYQMVEDQNECPGGWFWNEACIAGLATEDNRKIVITTDGKETLARLYDGKKVIKSASAKCSPSDKFDFNTGVKIAIDRLLEVGEKPKTFRDLLKADHPEMVDDGFGGGCEGCPCDHGYTEDGDCVKAKKGESPDSRCRRCWDRPIPDHTPDESATAEKKTETPSEKPEFEVGKYYKVHFKKRFTKGAVDAVIKITKIEGDRVHYERIEGNDEGSTNFRTDSTFAKSIVPIDYKDYKPKLFNGKVVCTKSEYRFWTVGKVYEFKDGIITDDDGDGHGFGQPFESFEDFKKRFVDTFPTTGKLDFIPVVD